MKRHIRHRRQNNHLSANFWDQVGGAFTDPDQRFEFPIKPFEYTLTKESQNALYLTAGIFAAGLITAAFIIKSK